MLLCSKSVPIDSLFLALRISSYPPSVLHPPKSQTVLLRIPAKKPQLRFSSNISQYVLPLRRWTRSALISREDRSRRNRSRNDLRHVLPVRHPSTLPRYHAPPPSPQRTNVANSLTQSCLKKCIPADYREPDLNKGESVCLDRCVAKFFEVNVKVSEKMQGEAAGRQGGGGGMFGM